MPPPTDISPEVMAQLAGDIVGPLVIGTLLNICLYGAMLMQAQTFYQHAANDPRWLKLVVGALLVVDTSNSVAASFVAYDYSVRDFGNVPKILDTTPAFATMVVTTALSGSIVQAFFGMRVKWLTKQTWLGALIVASAILQFLCGVAVITAGTVVQKFQRFQEFSCLVIIWLVLAPATDIVISGSLVAFLRSNRTGFSATDDILSKLTRLTIQTGLITVIWTIVDLVLFLIKDTNLHFIFNISLAKLYANCMLSSLNARTQWSAQTQSAQQWSTTERTGVKVTTTTGIHRDDIELDQSIDASQYRAKNVIEINREVSDAPHRHKPSPKSDGLSLSSDSDLEDGESKSGAVDKRVDWRGML